MKKLSLVLVLGMLLGLTACGSEVTQDETKGASDTQTESSVAEENDADKEDSQAADDEEDKNAVTSVAENFTYSEENGEITITGYEGEATVLEIPDSINGIPVVAIGENAFAGNEVITEVVFPDSVVLIDNSAFERCYSLTKATFGAKLETINYAAFWMAPLESVEFPDTVHTIGGYAFDRTNITELTIPPHVTVITTASFAGTQIEELVIPASVTIIEDQAFSSNSCLHTVDIEEGVEVIEEDAFENCRLLESVTLPSTLTEETDVSAFWGSGNDTKLTIYVPADCILKDEILEYYNIGYDYIGAEVIE